jgi:DNA polymerase I-like protein with 3'-5' exonuclease and polymerase domains
MKRRPPNGKDSLHGLLFSPHSSWEPPREFPNLSSVRRIGLDTESKDPRLTTKGPGFIRGDAEMSGISISTGDRDWYFPIRHLAGGNLPIEGVISFAKDLLARPELEVVVANAPYDLEALWSDGINVAGRILDIQLAEPLLDEEQADGYSLDAISTRHLGENKSEGLLKEAAAAFGIKEKGDLWKLHSKYVGPYAERDARLPLHIFEKQWKLIQAQGLEEIFNLETKLLPILHKMRVRGVPINLEGARDLIKQLKTKEDFHRNDLRDMLGYHLDIWSGPMIANACRQLNIKYPTTNKGNPSFTGDFLDASSHPILQKISSIRELNRLGKTFVNDWIFGNEINGRIHPQWKQLASDEGGTRTGRMAASNPNPQQVPSRSEFAYLIRNLFIPEYGMKWGKFDYSQQEPRVLVHYAYLMKFAKAAEFRQMYIDNPSMDIYKAIMAAASLSRRDSKDATLGRMYNMGVRKFSYKNNKTIEESTKILSDFDNALPFVKELSESVMNSAQRRGYIKTLSGRKRHFNLWEPSDSYKRKESGEYIIPVKLELAQDMWKGVRLQRAHTHKALNSLIQGSSADMTKSAIVSIYDETSLYPYLQVHDETDYPVDTQETIDRLQYLHEHSVKMEVPIKCEPEIGDHWK